MVQEAFCRLLLRREQATGDQPSHSEAAYERFAPLFFATIRNLSLDVLRRRARRSDVSLEGSGIESSVLSPPSESEFRRSCNG